MVRCATVSQWSGDFSATPGVVDASPAIGVLGLQRSNRRPGCVGEVFEAMVTDRETQSAGGTLQKKEAGAGASIVVD
jgi:hypothetical protein